MSIKLFSTLIIQMPLRGYQIEPANALIDSCLEQKGLEFLWVFPRQSGKDETVAQLVVFLLTIFQRTEAGIVHVYPSLTQLPVGIDRLEKRLENLLDKNLWWHRSSPARRGIGLAQCAFFSGHPMAKAEGATANLLLIINEVQDQNARIIERRFTPMRSSTNATALYVGTVRTTGDYLWQKKQELERLEAMDGLRRVFIIGADEVGAENPGYLKFVAGQVRMKGRQHPVIKTEYFNEPVDVVSGLFPERRRALMRGTHPRLHSPKAGELYVALIDVGGQDEAATNIFADLKNPKRDYTICTIVRVIRGTELTGIRYEVVDLFVDQGSRHFQDVPGQPSLFLRLLTYLEHWNVTAVVCDMTGIGQGLTDALIKGYKRTVFGFDFAANHNKARLGNNFLTIIETGRFKYFEDDGREGLGAWWFFTQCEHCGYELTEGVPLERGMKWGVTDSARVMLHSESVPVHDDYLLSAALVAEVDRLVQAGQLFLSTGESVVIPGIDVVSEIDRAGW